MKREASFCDCTTSLRVPCPTVAEDTCAVCARDYCADHSGKGLKLILGSPPTEAGQNRIVMPQSVVGSASCPLCVECRKFIEELPLATFNKDKAPAPTLFPMLGKMLAQIVADVKALKAAHALGARGEDLHRTGGRA